jgi:Polyketide cyclase / dehydrase and lipid transport
MATEIVVSRNIAAPSEVLFALISDLPKMGQWSPENTGGTWVKGATGPAVGARFVGVNSNGKRSWKTSSKVVACETPSKFGFDVNAGPLKIANWSYTIVPTAAGCTVTETWTDQRGWLITTVGGVISGVSDRAAYNRAGMEETLRKLAAHVET